MADHNGNHRCLAETNVHIALILPSRWQDGAESQGMKTTSCQYLGQSFASIFLLFAEHSNPRILTNFIMGSITVQMNSCLTGLNLTKQSIGCSLNISKVVS